MQTVMVYWNEVTRYKAEVEVDDGLNEEQTKMAIYSNMPYDVAQDIDSDIIDIEIECELYPKELDGCDFTH